MQFFDEPRLIGESDLHRYYQNGDTISLTRLAKQIVGSDWSAVYVEHRADGKYEYALINSRQPGVLKLPSVDYAEMAQKLDGIWTERNKTTTAESEERCRESIVNTAIGKT